MMGHTVCIQPCVCSRMDPGEEARVETMWWKWRSGLAATFSGTLLVTKWQLEMPAQPNHAHWLSTRNEGGVIVPWGGEWAGEVRS
jgi:hypothetical protein